MYLSFIFYLSLNIYLYDFLTEFTFPPPQGYEFIKELGTGGCGKVYLAKEILSGCLIAVKCVKIFNAYTLSVSPYDCIVVELL